MDEWFTIVIPVHNGMPFIKDCVESALNQAYQNYNIIILENMSDDGTAEYLDSLISDKITILKNDILLSIEDNWARIKDIKMNEYMTILMADDKLEENYLSEIVAMIRKYPNCNIYRSNINLMNEKSEVICKSNISEKITIYDYLAGRLKHTYTETAAGYCFKSSKYREIGGIDCKFRLMHTDDKLFMEAIGENNYMAVSPCHSTYYRCHTGSESGSPDGDAQIGGFNLWMNWIYNLNDKKLKRIVINYLPYHFTKIKLYFSKEVITELKKIYTLYRINENDFYHKFIFFILSHNISVIRVLNYISAKINKYKLSITRKIFKFFGIKFTDKTVLETADINICMATDENYVKYMTTTIISILKNAYKTDNLYFYILCDNISENSKNNIKSLKKIKDFKIEFLQMDINEFKEFPPGGPHISNVTYFRSKIAELLPDVSKIIYLDCDTIVRSSLSELFKIDLDGYYLAGVEDVGYYYGRNYNSKFLWKDGFYINAGILLMNLCAWRENDLFKKFINFTINEAEKLAIGDQDVINQVCKDKIKPLDYKWNVQDSFYRVIEKYYNPNYKQIIDAAKNPSIIHYTYIRKPWTNMEISRAFDWHYYDNVEKGFTQLFCCCIKVLIKNIFSIRKNKDRVHNIINILKLKFFH